MSVEIKFFYQENVTLFKKENIFIILMSCGLAGTCDPILFTILD